MNRKWVLVAVLLAFGMVSCGGDGPGLAGGRNGGTAGDDPDPDTETPVDLSSVELLASSSQLQSDGSTVVTLSAIAKNTNNQAIADIPVVFSASSGTLIVTSATTTAQGVATAELSIGGDPTNRTITATATVGTLDDSVDIAVIGSSIQIQGPSSLVNNSVGNYTVTLVNSAGTGIPNEQVTVTSASGNDLAISTDVTDNTGRIFVEVTGTSPGADTLTATALPDAEGNPAVTATANINVSGDDFSFTSPAANTEININTPTDVTVHWEKDNAPQENETIRFASTRGTPAPTTAITDADGNVTVQISSTTAGPAVVTATNDEDTVAQISVEFVATTASQVSLQADPGVIGPNETSTITAIVMDAANNRVKNKTVEFTLTDTTGGSLSTPSAVTNSEGRAQTTYTASSVTSSDDGVIVTGSVVGTGLQADASLTVAGRALFMVFGTGNTIIEDDTDTTYTKDYTLLVSDSSGKGVANTKVNLRLLPVGYLKGHLVDNGEEYEPQVSATCVSEDTANGTANGVLDPGEDLNGDEELTPGNVGVVAPGTVTTDENGAAEFSITYPQNYALWVAGRITASATVAGTESRKSAGFYFPASADDLASGSSPPNAVSPWGLSASCADIL